MWVCRCEGDIGLFVHLRLRIGLLLLNWLENRIRIRKDLPLYSTVCCSIALFYTMTVDHCAIGWGPVRGGNWEYSTRFKGKCHFHCLIHWVLLKSPLVKIGKKSKNSNCTPIPTFNLQFHHEVGLVQQNYFEFFLGMVYISSYKRSALKETDFNISGSFSARQEDLKIFFTTPHFQHLSFLM